MAAIDVTDFHARVSERSRREPVLVLFTSDAVPWCRLFQEALEKQIRERGGRAELVAVDVDRQPQLARRFGVQMVPTVKAFRGGQAAGGFVGARPPEPVGAFLEALLGASAGERLVEELRAEGEWRDVVAALDEDDHARAFELLLARAERGDAAQRERVRELMVALFADLGPDHPLAERYRRRLALLLY